MQFVLATPNIRFSFAIIIVIALYAGAQIANALTSSPMPSEVAMASGLTPELAATQSISIPWPTFADGTSATASECVGMVTARHNPGTAHTLDLNNASEGFRVTVVEGLAGRTVDFYYTIVCSRNAAAPVAVNQEAWGTVKAHYRE